MMRQLVFVAGALSFLAACADAPQTYRDIERVGSRYERDQMAPGADRSNDAAQPAQPAAEGEDTCGRAPYEPLVGTPAADIDRDKLPAHTRVIMPGQMITMDYAPGRLNIRVGPDGRVTEVRCF